MSALTALAPFRTRSFRFQWPADLCTAWALEMETLILGWYVLIESGSVLWLTVFGALMYVGTLLSPLLGMLGDRLGLRKVLAAMRLGYALVAGLILCAAASGRLDPRLVLAMALLSGLIKPTDIGMRTALVSATVPPDHLVAAMGISRTTQDSARIGGALAGAGFMASFGMVPAYLTITALYIAGALLMLRAQGPTALHHVPVAARPPAARPSPWRELKEGLLHVWHMPRLQAAMSLAALVNLTAFPLTGGLMPYIARDVFHLNQQGLGWLVASFASGALMGSLGVSLFGARLRPARTMMVAAAVWYLCLFGFALPIDQGLAKALLVGAGVAQSLSMVTLSILLLRSAGEGFRGRVMGVRMLAIYTLPLGLLADLGPVHRRGHQLCERSQCEPDRWAEASWAHSTGQGRDRPFAGPLFVKFFGRGCRSGGAQSGADAGGKLPPVLEADGAADGQARRQCWQRVLGLYRLPCMPWHAANRLTG